MSVSRLPGRPAVELPGGREDYRHSRKEPDQRSQVKEKGWARVEWKRCGVRRNRMVWVNNKPEARVGPRSRKGQDLRTEDTYL